MQCRTMIGLFPIADATSRIDLSCMGTCAWPLHMKAVVHADCWWQGVRRAEATKFTAGKLAAVVAYELPWDAIREHGSFEYCNHLSDRLSLRQPAGDDRAGMIVQDGHQIALKAVLLVGVEITDIHRPND